MDSFARSALETHNKCRAHHNVPALTWSSGLARDAQDWAKRLARTGKLEHAANLAGDGENIFMASSGFEEAGETASKKWYSEVERYDFRRGGYQSGTGHFTQVVWKASKEFAIARAKTSDGKVFVVGRYRPGGNDLNAFSGNVLPGVSGTPPFTDGHKGPDSKMKKPLAVPSGQRSKMEKPVELPSGSFITEVLDAHNKYRSQHGVAPLKWSDELAYGAQKWAQKIARENDLAHASKEQRKLKGENTCRVSRHYTVADVVRVWYKEVKEYDFGSPAFSLETGHFTQVVWKATSRVGVGKCESADGKLTYIVARYDPPGNVLERFEENVLPHAS